MKRPRQIAIADHLWETFERMAQDMGSDPDALVNQAMHVFARQNGYAVPGAPAGAAPPPPLPRAAAASRVLDAAERLESILEPIPEGAAAGGLLLLREDGASLEVTKDRFVVGRGRHCDLVIDSTKVSREHAAFVRDGEGWYIEDLGSSNGTWHRRERVTRKRIADGDEFFICAEKLRCLLR